MKGRELSDLAETATLLMRNQLQTACRQVDGLSCNQAVLDTLSASARELKGNEEPTLERSIGLEKIWTTLSPEDPKVRQVIGTGLSAYLKKFISINSTFQEITVLNRLGVAVASANIPDHYIYGDRKWKDLVVNSYLQQGAYISDIKHSEYYKNYIFEIIVPVFDANQELLGMIRAILRTDYINSLLRPFRIGQTGQALLVASDGTIISSRDVDLDNQVTYDFFGQVKPLLEETKDLFFQVERREGEARFIGRAQATLKEAFPETNWFLFVEQDLVEVQRPIAGLKERAIVIVIIVLVINVLLAYWFSREFTKPLQDMHLDKL
jgi:hypothetical protein